MQWQFISSSNCVQQYAKAKTACPVVLLFSQAVLMLLAVSLTMFFVELFVHEVSPLPHCLGKLGLCTLTYNSEHGNYPDVSSVEFFFLNLPQCSGWMFASGLIETACSQWLCTEINKLRGRSSHNSWFHFQSSQLQANYELSGLVFFTKTQTFSSCHDPLVKPPLIPMSI